MGSILVGGLCCVVFVMFLILSIPIYVYRLFCIIFVKTCRSDIVDILNPLSSMFAVDLLSKKSPRATITVNSVMSKHLSFSTLRNDMVIKNWIEAKDSNGQIIYEKFQQYPFEWLGFMWWKREAFNVDNHIFFHENLGSSTVTENELDNFTEKLLNAPFQPNQSPWELHLVHNYQNKKLSPESESMSIVILKIHHSLADGYSILAALVEGILKHPVIKMPVPRYPKRSLWQRIKFIISFPFNILYELSYVFSNSFEECPWKISDKAKSWHQLYAKSDLIPTQVVKDIKNASGVSFTSVLLSAISAGIYDNVANTKSRLGVDAKAVESLHCLSTLPIPGHKRILTNQTTAAFFNIPATKFPSPLERLQQCNTLLETTKQSTIPRLTLFYIYGVGCNLTFLTKLITNNSNVISTGLSNFPSLPLQIKTGELTTVAVHFAAGCLPGNAGVGFMVLSYGDYIRLAVTAEEAVLSRDEVNTFIMRFTNEITTLYDMALSKRIAYSDLVI